MKQEYTEKMNFYQSTEYERFLKDKCVLDARQYLHSSMQYLHYAIITERLYKDIGKMDVENRDGNMQRSNVEILGWHYDEHQILNKCTLEWVAHISNALDCLLQYINAALHLDIPIKEVGRKSVAEKLQNHDLVLACYNLLEEEDMVIYIRSVYNFSKHTLDLYGNSSLADVIKGQRDIQIPTFRYKKNVYDSRTVSSLMAYYETFIGLYLSVLDSIRDELEQSCPVSNRYHIGELVIDGHSYNKSLGMRDIKLKAEFEDDGEHIKRYWIDNPTFAYSEGIELMQLHNKTTGQHLGWISRIELIQDSSRIGFLEIENTDIDTSALAYHKYNFVLE